MTIPPQSGSQYSGGGDSWGNSPHQPQGQYPPVNYNQPTGSSSDQGFYAPQFSSPNFQNDQDSTPKKWKLGEYFSAVWQNFGGSTIFKILGWQFFCFLLMVMAAMPLSVSIITYGDSIVRMMRQIDEGKTVDIDGKVFLFMGLSLLVLFVALWLIAIISYNLVAAFSQRKFSAADIQWFHRGWQLIGYTLIIGVIYFFTSLLVTFIGSLVGGAADPADNNRLLFSLVMLVIGIPIAIVFYLFAFAGYYIALGSTIGEGMNRSVKLAWANIFPLGILYILVILIFSHPLTPAALSAPLAMLLFLWLQPACIATLVGYDRGTLGIEKNTIQNAPQPYISGQYPQ